MYDACVNEDSCEAGQEKGNTSTTRTFKTLCHCIIQHREAKDLLCFFFLFSSLASLPSFHAEQDAFFFVCFCFCCRRCFGCCLTCMCACLVKQCISFRDGTGNLFFFFFAGSRLSRLSFLRPFLAVSCINDSVKHFFFFFFADGTF